MEKYKMAGEYRSLLKKEGINNNDRTFAIAGFKDALDKIEPELTRLREENERLKKQLDGLMNRGNHDAPF